MLTYTMDVEERSRWIIATPPAAISAQPYFASEVGFTTESNFSYRFKQMVGQNPRANRQDSPELITG